MIRYRTGVPVLSQSGCASLAFRLSIVLSLSVFLIHTASYSQSWAWSMGYIV